MYNTKCSEVMIVHVAECCNSWIQDVKLRVVRSKHSISGTCGRWLRYDGILRWCQLTQMDKLSKRCLIDVYGLIPDWESRIQLYTPFAYFHEMVAWIFHLLNSAFASWTRSRPFFWPGGLFGPPKTTPEIGMHLYIYIYPKLEGWFQKLTWYPNQSSFSWIFYFGFISESQLPAGFGEGGNWVGPSWFGDPW